MGRPEWLADHLLELSALMCDPTAAKVTDAVERLTGRRPVTLAQFLEDHAAAFAPEPNPELPRLYTGYGVSDGCT